MSVCASSIAAIRVSHGGAGERVELGPQLDRGGPFAIVDADQAIDVVFDALCEKVGDRTRNEEQKQQEPDGGYDAIADSESHMVFPGPACTLYSKTLNPMKKASLRYHELASNGELTMLSFLQPLENSCLESAP